MIKEVFLALALSAAPAVAGDLSLMKPVVGFHPIVDLDSNNATGVLEVVADEEKGVGIRFGTSRREILTPVAGTEIFKDGQLIVQEYHGENGGARIEYARADEEANVAVTASVCPKEQPCELIQINSNNDPGVAVDAADFFRAQAGAYKIVQVGGEEPHGDDNAEVAASGSEANLVLPYCANAGGLCDPGYIDLTYSKTKVFKKVISGDRTLYTIQSGGKKYTWETTGGRVTFRNYQYQTADGRVIVLTHVLKKT